MAEAGAEREGLLPPRSSKDSDLPSISQQPQQQNYSSTDTGLSAVTCPQCGSKRLYKDGLRYLKDGSPRQRLLCRCCGYRFTNPNYKAKQKRWKNPPFSLNLQSSLDHNCQGNNEPQRREPTSLGGLVQTLATVENPSKSGQAGATLQSDAKGRIVEFIWWMKKQGYAESTMDGRVRVLKVLMKRGANLLDAESVKEVIARQKWSEGRKSNAVKAYTSFLKMVGGTWQPPICRDVRKLPFIPLEREIDDLIASCNQYIAAFLKIGKETGARAGEIYNLKWSDVDFERQTIRITAEKNSNPRIFKISNTLIAMLQKLPKKDNYIFHHYGSLNHLRRSFQRYRKKAAFKLGNPRLIQITFHTLRHWKATMEYAKTKDILHTMKVLGHKNIKNTLIYTQLVENLSEDEYVCKVAKTPNEVQELIEAGFEYVCAKDDLLFFRKRK